MKTLCALLLVSFAIALPASSFAGGTSGQKGIGFLVTDISTSLNLRIWLSEKITIEPTFSYSHTSPGTSASRTNLGPGLGIAAHWKSGQDLRPYIGGRISLGITSSGGAKFVDIAIAPVFWSEYFFSDHFSIGGEFQVIVILTDDDFSPFGLTRRTTYVQTAQVLTVQLYF